MSKHRDQDGAIVLLVVFVLVVWWLLRTSLRHPWLTLWLLSSAAVYLSAGQWGLIGFWLAQVLALAVWRWLAAGSFDRAVSWRARGSWRCWWVYGRRWRPAMTMANLGDKYEGDRYVPRLRRVRSNPYMDRLTVRLLAGQNPDDFSARADTLAHTFGQLACRVRIAGPGRVFLDFTRRDALAPVLPALPIPDDTDLRALPVGMREDGGPWSVGLLGSHTLIAGVTGAGKGSVLQSVIRAMAPAIRSGLLHLYGIDPKGGMELSAAGADVLYRRLATDDPEDWADLLENLVGLMKARARRLAGVTRLHTPSPDDPLVVLVIDELAALTAYRARSKEARDLFARIESSLNLLLSQGRAVGVIVVAALQDPRKEVLPNRDLFPTRIALRLVEAEATDMVLGPGARDRGADCTRIPASQPGVAWVWCDGEPEPARVRAAYPTDDDIAQVATAYRPIPEGTVDAEVIDLHTDEAQTPEGVPA